MTVMRAHKIPADMTLLRRIRLRRGTLLTAEENYNILSFARGYAHREGSFIEIGTYRGASAKLFCEAKGDKKFYVCDTFEGLPQDGPKDQPVHRSNQYACSLESVSEYLKEYPNITYVKGFFPQSAEGVIPEDEKFSFAHIDVDQYDGTIQGLEYLYPKMIPGGAIISHDFSILEGVRQAVHEFMEKHPEASLVELPTTQCLIIKP